MSDIEKIIDCLTTEAKPMKAGEIEAATGIDKKEISKHIKTLKTSGQVTSPKACYYEIVK